MKKTTILLIAALAGVLALSAALNEYYYFAFLKWWRFLALALVGIGVLAVVLAGDAVTRVASEPETDSTGDTGTDNHRRWAQAMHNRFSDRWNSLFEHVSYPVGEAQMAQMSLLLWEIASLTVDYLATVNNDPNLVQRNIDTTRWAMRNFNPADLNLKQFLHDPTTVPQRAIAVFDWLKAQGVESADVPAFGYRLQLEPNDTQRRSSFD